MQLAHISGKSCFPSNIAWKVKKNFPKGQFFLDIFQGLILNVGILLTFNHLFEKGG